MATAPTTDRAAWLAERQTGIGSTDAAACVDASPWKSRYQLWAEKAGVVEPDDIGERECVRWGNLLQRLVGDEFGARTGREIQHWPEHEIVRHPEHRFMLCSPDAQQTDPQRGRGLVELKTTSAWLGKHWEDDPPLHYQIQLMHAMAVVNADWGSLVCLVGGQRLVWFDLDRNDRFLAQLVEREAEFWERVVTRDPPEVDASAATAAALAKLWPDDTGAMILLPDEADQWDAELQAVKGEIKNLEERERLLKNRFAAALESASLGQTPRGAVYTYKQQTRKEHLVKESTFRVLRRKS